jgi:hypothetical protein
MCCAAKRITAVLIAAMPFAVGCDNKHSPEWEAAQCINGDKEKPPCPDNTVCMEDYRCHDLCARSSDCSSPLEGCIQKVCETINSTCDASTPCLEGFYCGAAGTCIKYPEGTDCDNAVKDGFETDTDCGGPYCSTCADGKMCTIDSDCQSQVCDAAACQVPTCTDGAKNGTETDVDCGGGGACPVCGAGLGCAHDADCQSGVCRNGQCQTPTCVDGVLNESEGDVDCGGPCTPCAVGRTCVLGADCSSGVCGGDRTCQSPSCTDGAHNGTETDVDCGGPCALKCAPGQECAGGPDCDSGVCDASVCQAPTCSDGTKNGSETDVDCGGSCPTGCAIGQSCNVPQDCQTVVCAGNPARCTTSQCDDGAKDGQETDIDCGGGTCQPCGVGAGCAQGSDCDSGVCSGVTCAAPTCTDHVHNGNESDIDCGGDCTPCSVGNSCGSPLDCNTGSCLAEHCSPRYIKASNTGINDEFGWAVSVSNDNKTLAVGAPQEGSNATGIGGDQANNSVSHAGAAYVFTCDSSGCSQQSYIKASNTGAGDIFGYSIALSGDGNTLAVAAPGEGSVATGVNGDQSDNSAYQAGAVYIFTRGGGTWSQQAYIKASNADRGDEFGLSLALSADGNTLAVGAPYEKSTATGIGGDQTDNSLQQAGAAYVLVRSSGNWLQQAYIKASKAVPGHFGTSVALSSDGATLAVGAPYDCNILPGGTYGSPYGAAYVFTRSGVDWSQQAYVKASNAGTSDRFGWSVSVSGDGNILAVGANSEKSAATGINGDQSDDSASNAGAAYLFSRSGTDWSQQAYVKASNTDAGDFFGTCIALSADGGALAVAAPYEGSAATGTDGNQGDNSASGAGAVYLLTRSGAEWSQRSYFKASNTGASDQFGCGLAISGDGSALAVGAPLEDSAAAGVNGDQADNSAQDAGSVYVYY